MTFSPALPGTSNDALQGVCEETKDHNTTTQKHLSNFSLSFLCITGSNAQIRRGDSRVLSFTVREGVTSEGALIISQHAQVLQNLLAGDLCIVFAYSHLIPPCSDYVRARAEFTGYFITLKHLNEPLFNTSTRINEATGEVLKVLPMHIDFNALPEVDEAQVTPLGRGKRLGIVSY